MQSKKLAKKLTIALCMSSMAIMPYALPAAAEHTTPIAVENQSLDVNEDVNITTNAQDAVSLLSNFSMDAHTINLQGNVNIDVTDHNAISAKGLRESQGGTGTTINLNDGDITIKAQNGYALYADSKKCYGRATINVNVNERHTVKIQGDIAMQDGEGPDPAGSIIDTRLTNSESYLSGDLKIVSGGYRNIISLTLKNQAVWYPTGDSYELRKYNANFLETSGIDILATDGVIDIYNKLPDTSRDDTSAARTFALDNINTANSGSNSSITFRIGSNVEANTPSADKIVLNGDSDVSATMPTLNHKIQVVGDPSITSTDSRAIDLSGKNIVVAEVDGTYLTDSNTTFTGSKYIGAAINGGLDTADLNPILEHNSGDNTWTLKELQINMKPEDGPALMLSEAAMQAAASAWRADNNDLMRRMGDLRNGLDESGAWARIYGGQMESHQGVGAKLDYRAVQAGYDRTNKLGSGKLVTGITLSHLRGDTSSVAGNGDLDTTMFGVYGSYIGDKGHFADLILKYGRMNNKMSKLDAGNSYSSEFGSNGFSISAEYGYRHNFKHNVYIEPQVELSYNNVGSSDYTMQLNGGAGANVHNDAYKSLIGRVGFTLGKQYQQNNVYLKFSLAHEFQGDTNVWANYNGVQASSHIAGKSTWLEYGIGFNVMPSKKVNIYGELEKSTGNVLRTNWRAQAGLRYSF